MSRTEAESAGNRDSKPFSTSIGGAGEDPMVKNINIFVLEILTESV